MSARRTRVMIWHRAPHGDTGAIEQAYEQISKQLAGTPGLLGNELLRAADDASRLLVMSEWESLAAFKEWEEGVSHRGTTSPLRRYQDRERDRFYEIYEVTAAY
jgi:heme-degrading monooxygenase HmoA